MTDEELAAIKAIAEAATHVSAERVRWDSSGTKVGYYHGGAWFTIATAKSWEGDRVDVAVASFIAQAREGVPALVAEVERLQRENATLRSIAFAGGPYTFGKTADTVRHVDPCDCDEDEESVGDACMANSEWQYGVFTSGSFDVLIVTLPRTPPEFTACAVCGSDDTDRQVVRPFSVCPQHEYQP